MTDTNGPNTLDAFAEAQPRPTPRPEAPSLHDVAAALHARRRDVGLATYGTALTTHNDRIAGVDLTQELADGLVYAIQGTLERAALEAALDEYRRRLDEMTLLPWSSGVRSARAEFDDLFTPNALRARADALARTIIADATGATP